jgi:hypothetical protein
MPYGIVLEFTGIGRELYEAVDEKLGVRPRHGPNALTRQTP